MSGLQFLASIVSSLAWPATVIIAVVILRKPLRELLPLLQKLKYKDLEFEFGKRLQEVTAEVAQLPGYSSPSKASLTESPAAKLALLSPRSAIIEAWRDVESTTLAAAHGLGEPFFQQNRPLLVSAMNALERAGKLDAYFVDVLDGLRELRNEAAHAPDFAVTVQEALDYVEACEWMTGYIRSATAGD